jgi:Protein of unknown function (DUF1194)
MRRRRVIAGLSATLVAPTIAALGPLVLPARAAQAVDVALVLAADVSRSINDDEFALQRRGYPRPSLTRACSMRSARALMARSRLFLSNGRANPSRKR